MTLPRVGVLASGNGSNLQALIDNRDLFGYQIDVVVSSRANAYCLVRAKAARIPAIQLPYSATGASRERGSAKGVRDAANRLHSPSRRDYEHTLLDALEGFELDLIVLAGWMLILSGEFLARVKCPVINVHPSLLEPDDPGFPVLRGARCVRDALSLQLPYTGVSVHHVIPEVDAGSVIVSEIVQIIDGDTEDSLYDRVKKVEHRLLPQAVGLVLGTRTFPHLELLGV